MRGRAHHPFRSAASTRTRDACAAVAMGASRPSAAWNVTAAGSAAAERKRCMCPAPARAMNHGTLRARPRLLLMLLVLVLVRDPHIDRHVSLRMHACSRQKGWQAGPVRVSGS